MSALHIPGTKYAHMGKNNMSSALGEITGHKTHLSITLRKFLPLLCDLSAGVADPHALEVTRGPTGLGEQDVGRRRRLGETLVTDEIHR